MVPSDGNSKAALELAVAAFTYQVHSFSVRRELSQAYDWPAVLEEDGAGRALALPDDGVPPSWTRA
jgi:hypothetical protein